MQFASNFQNNVLMMTIIDLTVFTSFLTELKKIFLLFFQECRETNFSTIRLGKQFLCTGLISAMGGGKKINFAFFYYCEFIRHQVL